VRWIAFGSQDIDVEETGSHRVIRQPSLAAGVPSRSLEY
jgi:hypothetical protein